MSVNLTRRGFLKGLAGVVVIASLPRILHSPAPNVAEAVTPPASPTPPTGMTYNWVRTALLGEPDMANLEDRIANGWSFVPPSHHPEMQTASAEIAFERQGLILMQCPTVECQLREIAERFAKKDKLSEKMKRETFAAGYIVQPNGEIIGTDGKPFNGTVSDEHAAIAHKWRQRAAQQGNTEA